MRERGGIKALRRGPQCPPPPPPPSLKNDNNSKVQGRRKVREMCTCTVKQNCIKMPLNLRTENLLMDFSRYIKSMTASPDLEMMSSISGLLR